MTVRRSLRGFERREALRSLSETEPILTVDDLAERFNVSQQTMRRDLRHLVASGEAVRTHGGAIVSPLPSLSIEAAFRTRQNARSSSKVAIARAALPLVTAGSTIVFDASTTVLALARILPRGIKLCAVVNSLPIALELLRRPRIETTMIGGSMRSTSLSASGTLAERTLRRLYVETAFISVRGLSLERGLSESNPSEAGLKALMIANAARVVALVDSSKLDQRALCKFADVPTIDTLITDAQASPRLVDAIRECGVEVIVASPEA